MSSINTAVSRITSMMISSQLGDTLNSIQQNIFDAQNEISTGKKVQNPSDDPGSVSAILSLTEQLGRESQIQTNLDQATGVFNVADQAMADTANMLRSAQSLASSQVGVGSDAGTRQSQATMIDSQLTAIIAAANRQYDGISVFGGDQGAAAGGNVFESFLGGVRYIGSSQNLSIPTVAGQTTALNSNGEAAFGALSETIQSPVDLNPKATADTRINDIGGALNQGVQRGQVQLTVDGTIINVDLSNIDTLGDAAAKINSAIAGIFPGAGSVTIGPSGFELTAAVGHNITIADPPAIAGAGGGAATSTAADLGITITATSGTTVPGSDVNVQLSRTTKLSDLATPVDWADGITITQGSQTKVLNLTGATTVEDLINRVDALGLGLKLQINSAKTGLDMVDTVSGLDLSVGENGGTTATDLGLRTFSNNTLLSDFRHGLGVQNKQGVNDLAITLHNNTTFNVNIDGATTVGDVVGDINAAAAAAGMSAVFSAGLVTTGNGMKFTDTSVGGTNFQIQNINGSLAGTQMGIVKNAGTGNTITGDDNATVQVNNLFTHLINLRDALTKNDSAGITLAGSGIGDDLNQVIQARADIGVQAKSIADQKTRSQDRQVQQKTMLSNLQDADMPTVITKYMQLQTQLQASLQVGAKMNQMNLLNYLS